MMGHFAMDCKRIGKGKRGGDGSKGYATGEGKRTEGAGKKGPGTSGGHKGRTFGRIEKLEIPRTAGRAVEVDTSRQSVDGESLPSRREDDDCRRSGT